MLTKISVVKTYWVGMTFEQKTVLADAVNLVMHADEYLDKYFNQEHLDAMNNLRQALLNV